MDRNIKMDRKIAKFGGFTPKNPQSEHPIVTFFEKN
jgi:hypothetical protein